MLDEAINGKEDIYVTRYKKQIKYELTITCK